ncbi:hypothetical protein LEP1GSC161_4183 [Leptospira santarosai str. CBC1416]|uniref:Uncharacterized protein n=3 Tax=Leptospira santarosai TaxID=28183 RepID=M6VB13_9LEPT|nr:hypothetical protein LEP1GSC068_0267 [Leptospira sp. Fiocruz LV3954]EKR93593.1 hypothetical protein LEP1GSC163_1479 [Leptospira santarosai str. CBC379]EKS10076.1 hypothetical protein LEP1GSC071_3450 [Leptospira santarosai str. JET]EMF92481.1 hypothetical protein LEP1GSC005_3951 [Leptospira santarosai str. ST188]EMI60664.1 hypothetical protein LEP1GSC076_2626 [Leptospira sp. Fiocruz LV4135]EMJ46398.1 hypothetical protein LEP1GSC169_3280 [Leptospira santarosai str. HAI1349]EMM75036.1 hypothe
MFILLENGKGLKNQGGLEKIPKKEGVFRIVGVPIRKQVA